MLPPEQDQSDRRPIWDALQTFWMDTDPEFEVLHIAQVCANSKYSLAELEQIYWNEVHPAVSSNLVSPAGEWAGFDIDWLASRIIRVHRFGKPLPMKWLHPHSASWWRRLSSEIRKLEINL